MKVIHHSPKEKSSHDQTDHSPEQGHHQHHHAGGVQKGLSAYAPLIALVGVALAASVALLETHGGGVMVWMHYFMGLFLCQFALVKLFDVPGFAKGFAKYDLLGARSHTYALVYPYLELALGLLYLAFVEPEFTYSATMVLLGFGALGVINAMRQEKDLKCACMGSILKVPLSHVTLAEDLGMAAMAGYMLLTMA